jgi:hypothetical protein
MTPTRRGRWILYRLQLPTARSPTPSAHGSRGAPSGVRAHAARPACPRARPNSSIIPVERRNVVGLAARHEVAVDHDLLVDPPNLLHRAPGHQRSFSSTGCSAPTRRRPPERVATVIASDPAPSAIDKPSTSGSMRRLTSMIRSPHVGRTPVHPRFRCAPRRSGVSETPWNLECSDRLCSPSRKRALSTWCFSASSTGGRPLESLGAGGESRALAGADNAWDANGAFVSAGVISAGSAGRRRHVDVDSIPACE